MPGGCILRLVDEDVIDAAVDAVKHPCRGLAVGQKAACFQDQIVEVEPAARLFRFGIAVQKRAGKAVQNESAPRGGEGDPARAGGFHAFHQRVEIILKMARFLLRGLGGKLVDLGAEGVRRACPCQHHGFQNLKGIVIQLPYRGQRIRGFLIRRGTFLQKGQKARQQISLSPQENLCADRSLGRVWVETEEGQAIRLIQGGLKGFAFRYDRLCQRG